MIQPSRGVALSIELLLVAGTSEGREPEPGSKGAVKLKTANTAAERITGVILKVVPIPRDGDKSDAAGEHAKPRAFRVTINSAILWSDWARDQSNLSLNASPRREAAAGANSVAAKGDPRSPETLVVVDLEPESKIETRFRALGDETTKGGSSPETAKGGSGRRQGDVRRNAAKPTRFTAADIRKGLFVEVDFHRAKAKNVASTVSVIRPLNPADATTAPAK
jgi:hypothetical protein